MDVLDKDIIKIKDLIKISNLEIPPYQRPYKWSIKNVIQLLNDITNHKKKSSYRIGTIVFHLEDKKETLFIVDGQQRLFTLSLIAHALQENQQTKNEVSKHFKDNPTLLSKRISNVISKENLIKNYKEIQREITKFDKDTIRFFFENCEVVKIVLNDISEAFQFFDSQNARGKDLEPHDLLKAFHLREMDTLNEQSKKAIIKKWENADDEHKLSPLFALNLFRVKTWCKRKRGRYFSKNDNYLFKGINIKKTNVYPYAKAYSMNHFYTENYNQHPHRALDKSKLEFPFQLDQPIINGQRFFDMVSYYQQKMEPLKLSEKIENIKTNQIYFIPKTKESNIYKIFTALAEYPKRTRQGDRYVRNLFNNTVLYYIDKFGLEMLEENIIKLFIWSYHLRLTRYAVKLASMDNHTRDNIKMFSIIREAISPIEIQEVYIPQLEEKEIIQKDLIEIIQLFKQYKYLK